MPKDYSKKKVSEKEYKKLEPQILSERDKFILEGGSPYKSASVPMDHVPSQIVDFSRWQGKPYGLEFGIDPGIDTQKAIDEIEGRAQAGRANLAQMAMEGAQARAKLLPQIKGQEPNKWARAGIGAAQGASMGAGLGALGGSFVPVIGTGVGAAIGGGAGALVGGTAGLLGW